MATPAPAPEAPIELRSFLVSIREDARNLSVVATGSTVAEAIRNAAPLLLQASEAPENPPVFGSTTQPLPVEPPPPPTVAVFARAPKPQTKK